MIDLTNLTLSVHMTKPNRLRPVSRYDQAYHKLLRVIRSVRTPHHLASAQAMVARFNARFLGEPNLQLRLDDLNSQLYQKETLINLYA